MSNYDPNAYAQFGSGTVRAGAAEYDMGLRAYMLGIYNHMTLALAISALVALGSFMLSVAPDASSAVARMGGTNLTSFGAAVYGSPLKWVVMLAPLAFIFFLSFRFERMSYGSLLGTFWAFAATMGLSLGSIFLIYKVGSIVQVFFVTAAAFGGLSLFGYTTKRNLSAMGSFLMMGLIGLVIAGLVNIFLQSSILQFALSVIGVLVFAGLVAFDTQRLKNMYYQLGDDQRAMSVATPFGALSLYINFINLFQFLLQFLGNREE
jgi:FtsH-binding integral membrane protein